MIVTVGQTLLGPMNQTFTSVRSATVDGPRPYDHYSHMVIELKNLERFSVESYRSDPLHILAVEEESDEHGFSVSYASCAPEISSIRLEVSRCRAIRVLLDSVHNPELQFEQHDTEPGGLAYGATFSGRYRILSAYLDAPAPDTSPQRAVAEAAEPEKRPLRKLLLKGYNPFAGLKYVWTGDPKRLNKCFVRLDEFCERCCPGGIDACCWFAEGKVVDWAPPEIAQYLVKQQQTEAPAQTSGRKLVIKGGSE